MGNCSAEPKEEPSPSTPPDLYRELRLPKRNYGYEKRQKELGKQAKREQKRQRKLDRAAESPENVKSEEPTSATPPPKD